MEEFARIKFFKWLTDEKLSSEKEDALFRLWNETDNVATKGTLSSFISFQTQWQFRKEKKTATLRIWQYASAAMLIAAFFSLFIIINNHSTDPAMVEYFSMTRQAETLLLPDSSEVRVNTGTMLLYPESYGKKTRTVYLYGEANFKVRKNAGKPFIVKSKNFSVTALGTEFDVSAYPENPYFKTTLITGSVKVRHNNCPSDVCFLNVNEQFVYDEMTGKCSVTPVDVSETTAWQRGELIFHGLTMKEIFHVLERKYAVSFQYKATKFNGDKYNFRFKKESSLNDILEVLSKVADDFNCEKVGNMYYIN
jgi:ferric-dicitrate binding protein FerR (iron transport regulator)